MADEVLSAERIAELRAVAEAATTRWHPWGDEMLPAREGAEAWAEDVRCYLGGEWGEYCALANPWAVLALLDTAERLAAVEAAVDVIRNKSAERHGDGCYCIVCATYGEVTAALDAILTPAPDVARSPR